jgi:hypothetical protein
VGFSGLREGGELFQCRQTPEEVREKHDEGEEPEGPEEPPVRFGYLASDWDVTKEPLPSGQYCAVPCKNFPEHFRKLVLDDPTEGESCVVDAY